MSRNNETTESPASCPQIEVLRGRDGRDGRDGGQGVKGEKGEVGPRGEKGDNGGIGPQGPQGTKGLPGTQGLIGLRGAQGTTGEKGDRGSSGLTGPQGTRGDTGQKGQKGSIGVTGLRGHSGEKGQKGMQGVQGLPSGGAVYVRWGRTSCPSGQETELLYSGRAGGSRYSHSGGGANLICLPNDPEYRQYQSGTQAHSQVFGVEYEGQFPGTTSNHNMPCAVCFTSIRSTVLMIPAKTSCPANWITEYTGYIMTAHHIHHRSLYECVDQSPESVYGLNGGSSNSADHYYVEAECTGFSCPPYNAAKELTCAVCTH